MWPFLTAPPSRNRAFRKVPNPPASTTTGRQTPLARGRVFGSLLSAPAMRERAPWFAHGDIRPRPNRKPARSGVAERPVPAVAGYPEAPHNPPPARWPRLERWPRPRNARDERHRGQRRNSSRALSIFRSIVAGLISSPSPARARSHAEIASAYRSSLNMRSPK